MIGPLRCRRSAKSILVIFVGRHPSGANYGYGRGNPVDRYYIEGFLARVAADGHGRVLEVGDHTYTRRFRWKPGHRQRRAACGTGS